jgi:hypothetical protein
MLILPESAFEKYAGEDFYGNYHAFFKAKGITNYADKSCSVYEKGGQNLISLALTDIEDYDMGFVGVAYTLKDGVYTYADGGVYQGYFADGNLHGRGTMTWANGDRYQGEYQNGVRAGWGIYWWLTGERYEGQFQNNKRHGYGTYYYASGSSISGYWENGVFKG